MAVAAVASVVIQKLTDMLTQESVINERGLVKELEQIKEALKKMGGYFLDAEAESKRSDAQVMSWTEQYLKHLYHVEDAIETYALRFPCNHSRRRNTSKLTFGLAFLKNFNLRRKIKKIRDQIDELQRARPQELKDVIVKSTLSYRNNNVAAPPPSDDPDFEKESAAVADHTLAKEDDQEDAATDHYNHTELGELVGHKVIRTMSSASVFAARYRQARLVSNYSFTEEKLDIVGFKKYVPPLVQTLVDIGSNSIREVVSIVGERGSGKSTLARAVYGNRRVKEHFESCSAWVTVSKGSCEATADLLQNLLRQIRSSKDQGGDNLISSDTDALKTKIFDLLKDKRYLIVLEDVERSEIWDDLQSAFPDQHQQSGSKILLITREKAVATHANSQVHQPKKLDDSDSWDLFLRTSGLVECPKDLEYLKPRILEVCKGLPLNVILLGSLLLTKHHSDWHKILDSQANWETLDLISLSYDDLPAHLKLCLIYMVLFPKESDIPVRRLQRLWLAEGFVSQESKGFHEDVVKGYFDELVKRSLIQVSKLTSDDSPKRCRLPGVLHDHLIPKAEVIHLFHVHNRSLRPSCEVADPVFARRLIEYTDIKNCSLNPSKLGSLRSYLSFNTQKKDTPATEVGKLLSSILSNGLRLLRVLDLEGVYKPSLPDNLGDFFHLRYLGLRWTFLDTLPESVGHLHYLETLDIKHTYISTLPPFIWKMKHLKHLNANGIHFDLPRQSCSSLPQLMSLMGFSVDDRSLKKDGCLKSLIHIRELEITFQLSNSEQLLDWISELTDIRELRLRSKDDMGRPSGLTLKPLSNLKQLTRLNLLGNLKNLPDKDDFPRELKVLTLSVSQLIEDPMPILGELPKLTVLRLLANSYLGNTMICPARGFKELRVLKLWMLKDLEHWEVKEGTLEKLKELNIRCCNKLKMIPLNLLQQINELTLTNMSPEFRSQVVECTKSARVFVTDKNYNFSPLPWEEADGSSDI